MQLPLPENEVARLEVLGRYQIFGTPPEECFHNITHLAAYVCGTPIALISLIDQNSQWFKSRVGWDVDEIPRGVSLCAQTILQSEAAKYFFRADTDVSFLSGSLVLIRRTFDVKSPEIVLPKLSTMVPSIASGLVTAGPSRALCKVSRSMGVNFPLSPSRSGRQAVGLFAGIRWPPEPVGYGPGVTKP